jgi:hypothetical protein
MPDLTLDGDRIARTIDLLCQRVEHRFPDSDLLRVARELKRIAAQTKGRAEWIGRPILGVRVAVGALILLIVAGLVVTLAALRTPREAPEVFQFIQTLESGINDVVLVGAAIFFLVTIETRIKRRRALAAIHELRALAHIIDMHQLTKDPEWLLGRGAETGVLPARTMSQFELSRYLDYCSEMLALTAKVAALYVQSFADDVALAAVNEVESLASGIARKIWQKLMIVYTTDSRTGAPSGRA